MTRLDFLRDWRDLQIDRPDPKTQPHRARMLAALDNYVDIVMHHEAQQGDTFH